VPTEFQGLIARVLEVNLALPLCTALKRGNFRIPQRRQWDIHLSAKLGSVVWYLVTDVSVQPIGLIPKSQVELDEWPEKFETLTAVTHLLITKYILKLAGICGFCNVNSCT